VARSLQTKISEAGKMTEKQSVKIPIGQTTLEGELAIPDFAQGVVIFAHGSGSGRKSPRNQFVANQLNEGQIITLLVDLLTHEEEVIDQVTLELRFDISLLAQRLVSVTHWACNNKRLLPYGIGYFGASTGAAAAVIAAAQMQEKVRAVVSRGGRPDLASEDSLASLKCPTLLIVGGNDSGVLELNESAYHRVGATEKRLEVIPGANHLFEEPGALLQVAELAQAWFWAYLSQQPFEIRTRTA
jgi:putative phosphoribosyl transferase